MSRSAPLQVDRDGALYAEHRQPAIDRGECRAVSALQDFRCLRFGVDHARQRVVKGPPDGCCFDLSLRVRSGLIAVQLAPLFVDLKTRSAQV